MIGHFAPLLENCYCKMMDSVSTSAFYIISVGCCSCS